MEVLGLLWELSFLSDEWRLDVLGTLRLMRLIIIVTHRRRFKFINFKLLVRNCRISALVLSAFHVFEQRILLKNAL